MGQLMGASQDISPVFTDAFESDLDIMGGDGVIRVVPPERCSCLLSTHADISGEAVREALELILDSLEFKNKPMLCGFLSHVVEETLAGRTHEIKGYTIATQVFGRKKDFDPTIDPIVRIQAGRLRRTLESYYRGRGRQDQLRIEIGKGSYVPTFYRLAVEDPRMGESEQPEIMSLPLGGISKLPVEVSLFSNGNGPSICVMPIVVLANDPDQAHLASGLAEELMNELACCHGLQVRGAYAAMKGREMPFGARQAGQEPGVRFFLVGSLRKEMQTVKLTLRLIDTATLVQIWGEQYKRDLEPDKMIDFQEEIARSVAGKIGGLFGIIPQKLSKESRTKATGDLEDYEALLRFSQYLIELSPRTHTRALQALELVRVRNPESGVPLGMLACLYANEYAFMCRERAVIEKAVTLAKKAVYLQPENQLVHALLAYLFFMSGRRELFFREAKKSLMLNPHSTEVVAFVGGAMALYGEWEGGLLLLKKGMELNPFLPGWVRFVPYLDYYRKGQYEEAHHEAEKFNAPHSLWDSFARAAALGQLGKRLDARVAVDELLAIKADFPACGGKSISLFVKDAQLARLLFDGLRKAGLDAW